MLMTMPNRTFISLTSPLADIQTELRPEFELRRALNRLATKPLADDLQSLFRQENEFVPVIHQYRKLQKRTNNGELSPEYLNAMSRIGEIADKLHTIVAKQLDARFGKDNPNKPSVFLEIARLRKINSNAASPATSKAGADTDKILLASYEALRADTTKRLESSSNVEKRKALTALLIRCTTRIRELTEAKIIDAQSARSDSVARVKATGLKTTPEPATPVQQHKQSSARQDFKKHTKSEIRRIASLKTQIREFEDRAKTSEAEGLTNRATRTIDALKSELRRLENFEFAPVEQAQHDAERRQELNRERRYNRLRSS
jgi:hypothetical protein